MGNTFTTTAAAAPAGVSPMTLTAARSLARSGLRNRNDTTLYSDTILDHAILALCTRFVDAVRPNRAAATIALVADDPEVDGSAVTDLDLARLGEAYLTGLSGQSLPVSRLALIDYTDLWARQQNDPQTGTPRYLAFSAASPLAGAVYPTPSGNCSLQLLYTTGFTRWTAGAAGDGITLDLDPEYLVQILPRGVAALVHANEPENAAYAAFCQGEYEKIERKLTGSVSLGARQVTRRTASGR
jgi:hypothetical protein